MVVVVVIVVEVVVIVVVVVVVIVQDPMQVPYGYNVAVSQVPVLVLHL